MKNTTLTGGDSADDLWIATQTVSYLRDLLLLAQPRRHSAIYISVFHTLGDNEGDGIVGVEDLLDIIARRGTNNAEANINEDRIVDVEDLLRLIGAWGACPQLE